MSRRKIWILSAALTGFCLVVAGAFLSPRRAATPSPAPVTADQPAAVPLAEVQQREAAYRKLIDEANARLRAQERQLGSATVGPAAARFSDREDEDRRERRRHLQREDDDDDEG